MDDEDVSIVTVKRRKVNIGFYEKPETDKECYVLLTSKDAAAFISKRLETLFLQWYDS